MSFYNYIAIIMYIIFFLNLALHGVTLDMIISSSIILIAVLGDYLLKVYESDVLRAFIDTSTHGLIGLLVWYIVALHVKGRYIKYEIIICGILSSLVDVDHFLKARSFHLKDALHQKTRPYLHCSTIPLLILFINIFMRCRSKLPNILRYGWMLWIAFSSHHIRDANRRGLWFYPLGSTPPLPDAMYILSVMLLPYATISVMNDGHNPFMLMEVGNLSVKSDIYLNIV